MFGVVLWSDPASGSAVIWCEDHGDLAYYDASGAPDTLDTRAVQTLLDTGDLVEFDAHQESDRLVALNPFGVITSHSAVAHAMPPLPTGSAPQDSAAEPGRVIDFQAQREKQARKAGREISRRG